LEDGVGVEVYVGCTVVGTVVTIGVGVGVNILGIDDNGVGVVNIGNIDIVGLVLVDTVGDGVVGDGVVGAGVVGAGVVGIDVMDDNSSRFALNLAELSCSVDILSNCAEGSRIGGSGSNPSVIEPIHILYNNRFCK
jgi:hypothetical protein